MRTVAAIAGVCWWAGAMTQDLPGETIYRRCSGAVVQLRVLDDLGRTKSTGSGIVLKDSAWLVTNNHILRGGGLLLANKNADRLALTEIIRSDDDADILIVRIDPKVFPETWARIPDLKTHDFERLEPGQRVYTIGNPGGLENSIADGLLSAKRTDERTGKRSLQISAPISPGSSGGGVFDARGRLIGISTFIYHLGISQNLNFAICMDDVIHWDRSATKHDITQIPVDQHYKRGIENWTAHNCAEAIAEFRLVPEDSPQKGGALYYTARCLHQAGDLAQAKEGYQKALQHDPYLARAHAFLAVILYKEGDVLGSFEHQNKAYQLDPRLRDAKVAVDDW